MQSVHESNYGLKAVIAEMLKDQSYYAKTYAHKNEIFFWADCFIRVFICEIKLRLYKVVLINFSQLQYSRTIAHNIIIQMVFCFVIFTASIIHSWQLYM